MLCVNSLWNSVNKSAILSQAINHGKIYVYFSQFSKSYSINKDVKRNAFTVSDLIQHISLGKQFYLKQLTNIFHTIEFSKLKSDEAVLLLKCCGSGVPDSSSDYRHSICNDIFRGLENANNLDVAIYNCYIKMCNENNVYLNYNEFLSALKCEPEQETYKLLMENVCQLGKVGGAFVILELMKEKSIPIDINIFNYLAMAHAIEGGLKLTEVIFNIMKSAQIAPNNGTKACIFKGLIKRNNLIDFTKAAEVYHFEFTPEDLLMIIKELGLAGNEDWLSKLHNHYAHIPITREVGSKIEEICIYLIHMKQPISAMKIYEKFVLPVPGELYGYKILKEMLHCQIDTKIIISLARRLEEKGLSEYLLEGLTKIALKLKYTKEVWSLLHTLKMKRPHYFWPLLVHYGNLDKENGAFYVLNQMKDYNVKANEETLENYVYPYCDFSNLKLLIMKLQDSGYTVREAVSPLVSHLLKIQDLKQASAVCNLYQVNITGKAIPSLLTRSWAEAKSLSLIINILKRYCESNKDTKDIVGTFLSGCLKMCKSRQDFQDYVKLIRMLKENKLNISVHSAGNLQYLVNSFKTGLQSEVYNSINTVIDFTQQFNEEVALPHPKDMDTESLECHLTELEAKNMETRGAIRKLLHLHAKERNLKRISELQTKLSELGYDLSLGMKSLIMHGLILGGHLDEALQLYSEITTTSPDFQLDSFKFIDLAALLLKNDQFDEAFHILESAVSKRKSFGNSKSIERNCRELLSACKNLNQIEKVFNLLLESKLCKPTNVILGPIMQIHLNSGDVKNITDAYINLANKYHCTPYQLEVFQFVLNNGDSASLPEVLKATEQVHGPGPARVGLIAALAENNQKNDLRRVLRDLNFHIKNLLHKRCDRWVKERKLQPLLCLTQACDGLSEEIISKDFIYESIVEIYRYNNDYLGALNFYKNLPEDSFRSDKLKILIDNMKSTSVNEIQSNILENKAGG